MYGAERRTVAVVIPCYKVKRHILDVLAGLPSIVDQVWCVDDACPEGSGEFIRQGCRDPRVRVVQHAENQGVGGATMTGYRAAVEAGADILVKMDGDGQMDPDILELFLAPIAEGRADYVKGNRFNNLEDTRGMPRVRLIGNASLSFVSKLSTGYWSIFDPTNGYTAIERTVAKRILQRSVAKRYFFETDMLFHLYMERAVVEDVPILARYGDEQSSLHVRREFAFFAKKSISNLFHRILVQHYLRNFAPGSLELPVGVAALLFGLCHGLLAWSRSIATGRPSSAGSVMLSAMPILVGVQLILSAVNYDMGSEPRTPRHPHLRLMEAMERRRRGDADAPRMAAG